MIGNTILIAHIGYPTATFKAPMIYNPYFQNAGPILLIAEPARCGKHARRHAGRMQEGSFQHQP
jgi:shikimate dehydrogenase